MPWILLFLLVLPPVTSLPELVVLNDAGPSAGGQVFNQEMGEERALQLLRWATKFTTLLLGVSHAAQRRKLRIALVVSTLSEDDPVASTSNVDKISVIELSQQHLADFRGNVTREIQGMVFEQMAMVWVNGVGVAPPGLLAGIGKLVRLQAGLAPLGGDDGLVLGGGGPWGEGSYTSARFLLFLQSMRQDFVVALNANMAGPVWNPGIFKQLFGQDVRELWNEWLLSPQLAPSLVSMATSSKLNSVHCLVLVVLFVQIFLL